MKEKKFIPKRTFKGLQATDLYFKNFRGVDRFNPKNTQANFAFYIDDETAEAMEKEGWYVRKTKVAPDAPKDRVPRPYIKVAVKWDSTRPPMVKMVMDGTETVLDEKTIKVIDAADIASMSIRIRAYDWDDSGKYGAAAILDRLQVLIKVDELDEELNEWTGEEGNTESSSEPLPFD